MQAATQQQSRPTRATGRRRSVIITLVTLLGTLGVVPGTPSEAAVPGQAFTETACEEYTDSIARLYAAGLGRTPDAGGYEFWLDGYWRGEWTLPRMAYFFVGSPEFQAATGELDDEAFVRHLYRNVLSREGEAGGVEFWTGELADGVDRSVVLLRFAESPENIIRTGTVEPALGPFNNGVNGDIKFECGPDYGDIFYGYGTFGTDPTVLDGFVDDPGVGPWQSGSAPLWWDPVDEVECLQDFRRGAAHYDARYSHQWSQQTPDFSIVRQLIQEVAVFPTAGLARRQLDDMAAGASECPLDAVGSGIVVEPAAGGGAADADARLDLTLHREGQVMQRSTFLQFGNLLVHAGTRRSGLAAGSVGTDEAASWLDVVVEEFETPDVPFSRVHETCAPPRSLSVEAGWTYCQFLAPFTVSTEATIVRMDEIGPTFQLTPDGGGYLPGEPPTEAFSRLYPGMIALPLVTELLTTEPTEVSGGWEWSSAHFGCGPWTMRIDEAGYWTALFPDDVDNVPDGFCWTLD